MDGTLRLTEIFEVGNNTTISVPAMSFFLYLKLEYTDYEQDPNGGPDTPVTRSVTPLTVRQHIEILLENIQSGERASVCGSGTVTGLNLETPQTTINSLPRGGYRLLAIPQGDLAWDWNQGFKIGKLSSGRITPFSSSSSVGVSWVGGACNSKFFGNGWLFSQASNQYAGAICDGTNSVLEQRSGARGFRADKDGVSQLRHNGEGWDNSGLLCGYHSDWNGKITARFGVKDRPENNYVNHYDIGQYQIIHNIGHTNYVAMVVVANSGWEFINVSAKYANYVNIEIRASSGNFINRPFMITFFGTS